MASQEQIQQMLDLMQQQMTTINKVQEENLRLREAAATVSTATATTTTAAPTTSNVERRYNFKKPDRPIIETDLDDRE